MIISSNFKIIEKVMHNQIYLFFTEHKLIFYASQYGLKLVIQLNMQFWKYWIEQ